MDMNIILVDTNIFLESLLSQEKAEICERFVDKALSEAQVCVTDFSLFSIILIAQKKKIEPKKVDQFLSYIDSAGFYVLHTSLETMKETLLSQDKYPLDFDDGLICQHARELQADIVTLDADFKKAGIKVVEPENYILD